MNMLHAPPTIQPIAAVSAPVASPVFGNMVGTAGVAPKQRLAPRPASAGHVSRDASGPGQLHQHINSCRRSAGPLHHVHCFVELMYETVATRLVTTTVLLLAGMMAINALV